MLRIVYESNKDVNFFVISNSDPVMAWQATYIFFFWVFLYGRHAVPT